MKKIIGSMAVAMLLTAALIVPASAQSTGSTTCDEEDFPQGNKVESDDLPSEGDAISEEWGTLDWDGDEDKTLDYNILEGWTVDVCVKIGGGQVDGGGGVHVYQTLSGSGTLPLESEEYDGDAYPTGISHVSWMNPVPETHTVTFAKDWDGDDFDTSGVTVDFTVEVNGEEHDDNPFSPGDTLTVEEGDDVQVTEEDVSDFVSETCDFTEGVPETLTDISDDATLTVTNTIDCEDTFDLTLEKDWDVTDEDDLWDEDEASYTLLLNGDAFTGEPIEVTEGDEVEIGEEDVVVADGCEFLGSDARTYTVDPEDADEDGLITLTLTNEVDCAEVEEEVLQTITLNKVWEGDDFEGSDDVEVTFDVLIDGEEVTLADGEESEEFDGDADWTFEGENVTGFPDDCEYETEGPDEDGTVTNTVDCAEVEDEVLQTITLNKVWEGDDFEGSDDVEVTFDVNIDGEEVTLNDGETSEPFPADADWSFVGENVDGFPDDCDYETEGPDEDGTVTNTVDCEAEVLAESIEAEDDEETLPETGASTLLLSLLGLTALGSGGVILRRR